MTAIVRTERDAWLARRRVGSTGTTISGFSWLTATDADLADVRGLNEWAAVLDRLAARGREASASIAREAAGR